MLIREILKRLGGDCLGDDSLDIAAVNAVSDAGPGEITFVGAPKFLAAAEASGASAIVVPPSIDRSQKTLIRTPDVVLYTAELIRLLHPEELPEPGIHPTAVVARTATIGQRASVGPHAVIEDHCRIGQGSMIGPGVWVGRRSTIGDESRIYARVVIYPDTQIGQRVIIHGGAVIGADGFRFVPTAEVPRKVPQIGYVRIDDDVEIGANTCIDRASFGATHIEAGVKIDNLVQIGHNCVVGANSILVSQSGLAGSVRLGHHVMMGGQAGIADHVTVGDYAQIAGGSGLRDDIPARQRWVGYPARPVTQFVKETSIVPKLVKLYDALRDLAERRGKDEG